MIIKTVLGLDTEIILSFSEKVENILLTLSLKSDREGFTTFKAYKRSRIHKFGVL